MEGYGVLAAAMVAATATVAAQPNVVLILADDLGYGDIGANVGTTIATPHIDAMAKRGVRLTQGYVSHPVCSPSRAGLMTGRYQQRHGWEFNPAGRDRVAGMSREERTLADVMRAAGYHTGLVGKWHLGSRPEHHPINRGFDEFFGMAEGGSIYIDADVRGVESWGAPRIGRPNRINLIPYLDGPDTGAPHDYLFWRSGPNWAVRDNRWKLIGYNRTVFGPQDLDRTGRLKPPEAGWPIDSPNGQLTLLYDLANDPSETVNYAAGRPAEVQRLTQAWMTWNAGNAAAPILPAYRSTLADLHGETVQLVF